MKEGRFFWGTLALMLSLSAMFASLLYRANPSSLWIFAFMLLSSMIWYVIDATRQYRGFIKTTTPRYIDRGRHEGLSELYDVFARAVRRADLKKMPRLCVVSMHGFDAFMFKPPFGSISSIGISTDMLMKLNLVDIEAIFGHEIAHLRMERNIFARCALYVLSSAFFWFGAVWALMISAEPSLVDSVIGLSALLLAFFGYMLDIAASRRLELACDAYSDWLTRSDLMGVTLEKISPKDGKRTGLAGLLTTVSCEVFKMRSHPTLEERKAFLKELGA